MVNNSYTKSQTPCKEERSFTSQFHNMNFCYTVATVYLETSHASQFTYVCHKLSHQRSVLKIKIYPKTWTCISWRLFHHPAVAFSVFAETVKNCHYTLGMWVSLWS